MGVLSIDQSCGRRNGIIRDPFAAIPAAERASSLARVIVDAPISRWEQIADSSARHLKLDLDFADLAAQRETGPAEARPPAVAASNAGQRRLGP
jgi:hypothetical protein